VVDHALKGRAAQRTLVVQTVPAHGRNLGVSLCSARMRDFAPGRKPSFQVDNPRNRPALTRRRRARDEPSAFLRTAPSPRLIRSVDCDRPQQRSSRPLYVPSVQRNVDPTKSSSHRVGIADIGQVRDSQRAFATRTE
jgi:hypothetical protein